MEKLKVRNFVYPSTLGSLLTGFESAASERSSPGLEHTSYPTRDPIGRETSAGLRSTPPRSPQFFPRSPSRTGYSRSFRTGPQYGLKTISPDDDDSSSVQLRHLKSTPPSRSPPLHSNLPPPAYRPPRPPFDPNELIDADIDADVDADAVQQQSATPGKRRWQPTKKLTFAAMAGLKALHTNDPHNFTRSVLSERFGISVEAVRRILKSDFRQSDADGAGGDIEARPATKARSEDVGRKSLRGSKWDRNNLTSESYSPVPAIMRAYGNLHARPKHPESK